MSRLVLLSLCFFAAALAGPDDEYAKRPTCGDTGKTCVKGEAECVGGKCSCSGDTFGPGNFRCFEPGHYGCEIKNDPTITTFNREEVHFPFPCRFLATHIKPLMKDKNGNVIGVCEAKVYGFNAKNKGKLYVLGFDVALRIRYNNPVRSEEFSFRSYGSARNNENSNLNLAKNGQWNPFVTDGRDNPDYYDTDNGVNIHADYDIHNNRFMYTAQGCGLKVTFVPYDVQLLLTQAQIPGLAVSVDSSYSPEFFSEEKSVCMVPKAAGGQLMSEFDLGGLSESRWMFLRTFRSNVPQQLPLGDFGNCQNIKNTLSIGCQAGRRKQAMRNCDWILKDTQFAKCYDISGSAPLLMALFNSCAEAWCTGQPCTEAISLIETSGCGNIGKVPKLSAFKTGALCPIAGASVV